MEPGIFFNRRKKKHEVQGALKEPYKEEAGG